MPELAAQAWIARVAPEGADWLVDADPAALAVLRLPAGSWPSPLVAGAHRGDAGRSAPIRTHGVRQ